MLYIIRHGQTEGNVRHVLLSRSDQSLTETGIRQAEEAALRLKGIRFARVYSSPLKRALETAGIVAPGLPVTVDERLIEMDYGPYEGMDLRSPAPEGGEQLSSVVARAGRFLADVEKEGDILISTHAIAMKGFLEFLTPDSRGSYWSKNIPNCAVYTTEYLGDGFTVPVELAKENL